MPLKAILFDLDDTLVVEVAAANETFRVVCRWAAERFGVEADALETAVRRAMNALWPAAPALEWSHEIGIGGWEAVWAPFEGDDPNIMALREWSRPYRVQCWVAALAACGIQDDAAAHELADRFIAERRGRFPLFPGALPLLDRLTETYRLGMVTNGLPVLQRVKLRESEIAEDFPEDTLIVSGDHGIGKPDPRLFRMALDRLGAAPDEAAMVGNSLRSDIAGAKAAGIRAIWINLDGETASADRAPDVELRSLEKVAEVLE